jgi:two-component system sensor histidine kinase KdpD
VLVATRYGLRIGIVTSVAVSLAYNLLLSDPFLRFTVNNIDDLIPLIAFNLSAVASAYLAGRLRDEARRSHEAHKRVDTLLSFSQALQQAAEPQGILRAARQSGDIEAIEFHLDNGRVFSSDEQPALDMIASYFRDHGPGQMQASHQRNYVAERFSSGLIIVLAGEHGSSVLPARMAMLAIAAERWLLTEQLVSADVLRRSEDFKTTLLSSVSHDLRTPLAIISAAAGSLLRYPERLLGDAQRDLLLSIEQQSTRLNQMTENLLNLVRIEGGLDPASMAPVDLVEVLGSALVTVRQFAPNRTITKKFTMSEAVVRADPSLLEQVFINILQNAVVHTPPATPIHVEILGCTTEVTVAVEDSGPGVSPEDDELIFERFQQGQQAGPRHPGSGVGLSIARGFARAIGGDVSVRKRRDGRAGARFEVSLPLAGTQAAL